MDSYIILNLETTGVRVRLDRITSVEALLVENGRVTEEFFELANPGFSMSAEVAELMPFSDKDLTTKEDSSKVVQRLERFIGDRICVSYNPKFEKDFLAAELSSAGKSESPQFLSVLKLMRYLVPGLEEYSSDSLAKIFDLDCDMPLQRSRRNPYKVLKIFLLAEQIFNSQLGCRKPTYEDYLKISVIM